MMSERPMPHELYRGKYAWREVATSRKDLDDYHNMFCRNLGNRDFDLLTWRYVNGCRDGTQILIADDVTEATPTPASLYALHGVDLRIDGVPMRAAQSIDTVTDDHHKGRGIFPWLAERSYDVFQSRGGQLVFGFPNPNSHITFAKRLGWHMLDPLPVVVRPLRLGFIIGSAAVKMRLPRAIGNFFDMPIMMRSRSEDSELELRSIERFNKSHDDLWRAFARNIRVCVNRSAGYMNWRILDHPHRKYKGVAAYRRGDLVAEVVWSVEAKHGGKIGYIVELLHHPDDAAAGCAVLSKALMELEKAKCDVSIAWNLTSSPNAASFSALGFFSLPTAMRPVNLHWGVRSFNEEVRDAVTERRNWYISYTDSDTV
jgi:hypothetical protein